MDPIVTLNGFTFNPPNADGTGFELDEDGIAGWYGSPKTRAAYTERSSDAGAWYSPLGGYESERAIVLTGEVVAADQPSLLLQQLALAAICPDPGLLYTLQVTDASGTFTAQVQRSSDVLVKPLNDSSAAFSISVTAPDPYKYDTISNSAGSILLAAAVSGLDWSTGGGLDWSSGGGLNWGTSTSDGTGVLINAGTAPSWPIFTINGPTDAGSLVAPSITNTATGQIISYSGTLNVGDSLVINTNPALRSAILNGSIDSWSGLTVSQWFAVPAGGQVTVQFQGSSGSLTPVLLPTSPNTYF